MVKREPLRSEEYFDQTITFKRGVINRDKEALAINPGQFVEPEIIAASVFKHHHNLFVAEYSRGYPLAELQGAFSETVTSWEQLKAFDRDNVFAGIFKTDIDNYVRALWLLSQAYLLGIEPSVVMRLLACIGNEGEDLLFERLVTAIVPELLRKPAKKLLYPKPYQALYDALDAPSEQRATLIQEFLKQWYKRMNNTGWHDAHKAPKGGGFVGYWCWEAAGVAHAFGIDDSSFRDLPYYPKDLADFAHAAKLA
ncbi:PoNi-like cognate immunity protein [Hymenobacter terrenus]|uniref:PoNi-like cognate immunity protein n=1 Tax=Hymenobacter terrenus TaxID=1629124 RepID=UPI0006194F49|nr:PoNi-like cognate immunity protein [Hymenobacter terrenus]